MIDPNELPTMAPGQEPYTPEEWAAVRKLIAEAAEAAELLSPDELEDR